MKVCGWCLMFWFGVYVLVLGFGFGVWDFDDCFGFGLLGVRFCDLI